MREEYKCFSAAFKFYRGNVEYGNSRTQDYFEIALKKRLCATVLTSVWDKCLKLRREGGEQFQFSSWHSVINSRQFCEHFHWSRWPLYGQCGEVYHRRKHPVGKCWHPGHARQIAEWQREGASGQTQGELCVCVSLCVWVVKKQKILIDV